MLTALAVSLATLILVLSLPYGGHEAAPERMIYEEQETLQISEIVPTRQGGEVAPPPPRPAVPVIVPNDVVLEPEDLDFEELDLADGTSERPGPPDLSEGDAGGLASAPTSPRLARFVTPTYPEAAQKRSVRARIDVRVLVNSAGEVEDAEITRILRYEDDEEHRVPEIGYGLERSALAAARKLLFRPARSAGEPVASYTTMSFRFGIDT